MAPKDFSEVDVIQNKLNVLFAEQKRLLATWLPPPGPEEASNVKSQEELDQEEEAMFAPVPATLGVGASLPTPTSEAGVKAAQLTSNDRLRKRMLGKNGMRSRLSSQPVTTTSMPAQFSNQNRAGRRNTRPSTSDDVEDEDEGRSALGKKKERPGANASGNDEMASFNGEDEVLAGVGVSSRKRTSKRPPNFLDEVLAEGSKRKKKRSNAKDRAKESHVSQ
ncbi:MAG: hypothetical protein M1833_005583 [Piccolia ochrophora]|nr:MAG: hypothetical protein M1833_005583 [Piccolia ochrophora]